MNSINDERLSIGQFSKLTRLSIKALRLYDDLGLLPPTYIDPSTGYRYYAPAQAAHAEAIRTLRMLEMPLDEIKALLFTGHMEVIRASLLDHQRKLEQRAEAIASMLDYLRLLIEKDSGVVPYEIVLEEKAPQRVVAMRVRTGQSEIREKVAQGFGLLASAIQAGRLVPSGTPLLVYHDEIDEINQGDIELCIPSGSTISSDGQLYSREIEGGTVAATVHRGAYQYVTPAYHFVAGWIARNRGEIVGPPREIYVNDPRVVPDKDRLTRIEFPFRRA